MSDGNGHPYSWAAICNGYNPTAMANCPFPAIPQYLAEESWPAAKIPNVNVTHVWTQEELISEDIAKSSLIDHVCENMEDMIGHVDAVLLARDDAENHKEMALPFLRAGLPIFIDKPLATSLLDAHDMLEAQQYEGQLFSCSSLKFAKELLLTNADFEAIGTIQYIEAQTPKYWNTYAVHLLDPIVSNVRDRGKLVGVSSRKQGKIHIGRVRWQNLEARIAAYSTYQVPLEFTYFGSKGNVTKSFANSFNAFKSSIELFLEGVAQKSLPISREETLEIVEILEKGK